MAHYRILYNKSSPNHLFVIARRTIDIPGRAPIRDRIKQPCDEYGNPVLGRPVFVVASTEARRSLVEDQLLNDSYAIEIFSVRQL